MTKKKMLKSIVLVALGFTTPAMVDVKLGIAAEPFPTFASKEASGEWVGWEIEIGDALARP